MQPSRCARSQRRHAPTSLPHQSHRVARWPPDARGLTSESPRARRSFVRVQSTLHPLSFVCKFITPSFAERAALQRAYVALPCPCSNRRRETRECLADLSNLSIAHDEAL